MSLLVGTWSVARKQSSYSVGGRARSLTTLYFKRKQTKFVGNETVIYGWNRSSLCLLFVKLARLCVFSSLIRPITYARASREHVFDASGRAKPEPQQRRQWEGANVRQKNPSPQTLRSPMIRERLVVTTCSTVRSCRSMSSYGECLPPLRECSSPDWNRSIFFVQTFVDFPLSLPGQSLWVCLHPGPWFFLRNDKYGQEMKISSKCPTSTKASLQLYVKYVKGC